MKASVFIGTSLDGYIARRDGRLDWLPAGQGDDYGYQAFIETVDVIVMGRHTYETVLGFGEWPYDRPVRVLTSRPLVVPEHLTNRVDVMSGEPHEIVERLAANGAQHLYVDGGQTITRFLAAGQITDLVVSRVPVLIGSGIPLFGHIDHDIRVRHLETRTFPSGLVQSRYEVVRD